jgi:hypothetical protein
VRKATVAAASPARRSEREPDALPLDIRRASADIEYATRASDNFITDAQITIAESDLTADTSDISLRLEPLAAAGGVVEVNRQAGCKKRNWWLR